MCEGLDRGAHVRQQRVGQQHARSHHSSAGRGVHGRQWWCLKGACGSVHTVLTHCLSLLFKMRSARTGRM
jgi:hypothetical protein